MTVYLISRGFCEAANSLSLGLLRRPDLVLWSPAVAEDGVEVGTSAEDLVLEM